MVKNINPSFVQYLADYLKKLLSNKTGTITAEQFQGSVTSAVNDYLKKHYGRDPAAIRSVIAQSTPEAECAKAIKARDLYNIGHDDKLSPYKMQAQVESKSNEKALADAKAVYSDAKNNTRGLVVAQPWRSSTSISLPDMKQSRDSTLKPNKKSQQIVSFEPNKALKCGNCWICNTDVMSYSGPSIQSYKNDMPVRADTPDSYHIGCQTPCGDCEHVAAIMTSYIAGMLSSAGFAKFYWASYYVACVECNRRKSNYTGVKLSATKGWEVDATGIDKILNAIFPNRVIEQHLSEYNPIRNALTEKYNNGMSSAKREEFRNEVRGYIKHGTSMWCAVANDLMRKTPLTPKKINMSFNVSKIIVAITGHLQVIMSRLEKKANSKGKRTGKSQANSKGKSSGNGSKKAGGAPPDNDIISSDDLYNAENDVDAYIRSIEQIDDAKTDKDAEAEAADKEDVDDEDVDDEDVDDEDVDDEDVDDEDVDDEDVDDEDAMDDTKYGEALIAAIDKYNATDFEVHSNKLFKQYDVDADIFKGLMDNLLMSMDEMNKYDTLLDMTKSGVAAASSAKENLYPHAKDDVAEMEFTGESMAEMNNYDPRLDTTKSGVDTSSAVGMMSAPGAKSADTRFKMENPSKSQKHNKGAASNQPAIVGDDKDGSQTVSGISSSSEIVSDDKDGSQTVSGISRLSAIVSPNKQRPVLLVNTGHIPGSSDNTFMSIDTVHNKRSASNNNKSPPSKAPTPPARSRPSSTVQDENQLKQEQESSRPSSAVIEFYNTLFPQQKESSRPSSTVPTFGEKMFQSDPVLPTNRIEDGGKRLNKRQSKKKSQKRNQKNKTKRISYIKHKQTRKNQHSRKTKSKRYNKK